MLPIQEYTRQRLPITTLSEAQTIQQLVDGGDGDGNDGSGPPGALPQSLAVPTSRPPVAAVLAQQQLSNNGEQRTEKMAEVYVWSAGVHRLDDKVWE